MAGFSNWHDDGGGFDPPPCPRCDEPVRDPAGPRDQYYGGVANPPWNAGWSGTCERCGERFEHVTATIGTYSVSEDGYTQVGVGGPAPPASDDGLVGAPDERPAHERLERRGPYRTVGVRPAIVPIRTFIDEGMVFAGVELEVTHQHFGEAPTVERMRLTLDELEELRAALDGDLRPVAQQWSWAVDNT